MEPSVTLTDSERQVLLDTWKLLEGNIARVGVITFLRLFETHPDVQGFFPSLSGMTIDDLRHSRQLQTHALKVMGFVQKVVARLQEPAKLYALVRQLGRSHVHYGAKQAYIDFVGPQFVYAIKPALEDQWTTEIEGAWLNLFGYVASIMKAAMTEVQQGKVSNSGPTAATAENASSGGGGDNQPSA